MKRVYIAGKITGNPNYKSEFAEAENELLNEGYAVLNPAILPEGFEQQDYYKICMSMIDVCDEVYFLPNWIDSKGACLEMGYARGKGKKIILRQYT